MAIHLIPLFLAKVAGKFVFKKAAHHGAHRSLVRKVVKEGGKKVIEQAVDRGAGHKQDHDKKGG